MSSNTGADGAGCFGVLGSGERSSGNPSGVVLLVRTQAGIPAEYRL